MSQKVEQESVVVYKSRHYLQRPGWFAKNVLKSTNGLVEIGAGLPISGLLMEFRGKEDMKWAVQHGRTIIFACKSTQCFVARLLVSSTAV